MRLSRKQTWVAIQLLVFLFVGLYQLMWWLFGVNTTGYVQEFYQGGRDFPVKYMLVEYYTPERRHATSFVHDPDFDANFIGQEIKIEYLSFARASARLPRFSSGDRLGLVAYGLFLFVTLLIFIMPNYLIGRQSYFEVRFQPPFLRYISGKPVTRRQTLQRVITANIIAGYIEKFMLPFAGSAVVALFLYITTWQSELVIAAFIGGTVLGVWRAYAWRRQLKITDDELVALDELPGSDDALADSPAVITRDSK